MIRVKLYITLEIDEEEYAIPADENVGSEIEDSIKDHLYDINGVRIKNIRTIQGD